MKTVYRIFPAIGIGRLGNSPDSFFLSPEVPGLGPLELTPNDSIHPVENFKDADYRIKRQAVRFRIYELKVDDNDTIQSSTEITSNEAKIEWHVELANLKAAAGRFVSASNPEDTKLRNPEIPEVELSIKPTFPTIGGTDESVKASHEGKFKGIEVYLGELKTDHKGRLMVLGGRGFSSSVPDGKPLGDGSHGFPGHPDNTFANNEGWHDDVADGPISATITFDGQQPIEIADANSAWVIIAPPDYSPYTNGITTFYDWAFQNAVDLGLAVAPTVPSFDKDIKPIIESANNLKWVSSHPIWASISTDFEKLAKSGGDSDQLRSDTFDLLNSIQESESNILNQFYFTRIQIEYLTNWRNGNFVQDYNTSASNTSITPEGLNKASLTQAVGGGFYPGIEAGIKMTYKEIYDTVVPFRLNRKSFTRNGVPSKLDAGSLTRNMACPWQSDFFECEIQEYDGQRGERSIWWPVQRPIRVKIKENEQLVPMDWIAVNGFDHKAMVEKFGDLGLIEKENNSGDVALIEKERNPALPRS